MMRWTGNGMRRQLGVIAAVGAVVLGSGAVSAAALTDSGSSSPRYAVKVVDIDRAGRTVDDGAGAAQVAGGTGQYVTNQAGVLRLPAGTYVITADIETMGSGDQFVSQTLATAVRTVPRSLTITLDARSGKPVTSTLAVPGAAEQDRTGTVCARMIDGYVAPVMWAGPLYGFGLSHPVPLYAVPVTSKYLQFSYATQFAAPTGMYYVAAQADGRVPASPKYPFSARDLAKVTVEQKTGTTAGGPGGWEIGPGSSCNDYGFDLSPGDAASRLTQYVSAGKWTVSLLNAEAGSDSWLRTYGSGQSYLDVFGAAVRGPIEELPAAEQRELFFQPNELFGDPTQSGVECCATVNVTLRVGTTLVKRSTTRAFGQFSARIRRTGWYNLTVDATQRPPSGVAAAPLSTRVVLSWHAYVGRQLLEAGTLPVSLARFEPQGLDMGNNAAPGGHTVTRMYLNRIGIFGIRPPLHALRTVRIAVSVNNGRTWRELPATRKAGYWTVDIPDPASGYVSLRSTVTDVKGNSSVETIYRAFGVS